MSMSRVQRSLNRQTEISFDELDHLGDLDLVRALRAMKHTIGKDISHDTGHDDSLGYARPRRRAERVGYVSTMLRSRI
jgi:hypothetical protein